MVMKTDGIEGLRRLFKKMVPNSQVYGGVDRRSWASFGSLQSKAHRMVRP